MSSTEHISYEQPLGRESLSGSANWAFDNGTHTPFDPRVGSVGRSLAQFAILAAFLAVSPMTTGPDPWSPAQQQRSQLTISSAFRTSNRRRITMREALRLADEIMRRAEEGRMKAAEEEASRQFDLESLA